MTSSAAVEPRRYRYADLFDLPDDKRYEIIDGELFVNPSPVTRHQRISSRLNALLREALETVGAGEVFYAPLDIVFDDHDVVQPDLFFVSRARSAIVTEKNVQGSPDLVIEILSDGTRRKDLTRKRALFARFAVPLYLVVDPDADRLELYRLASSATDYDAPVIVAAPGVLELDVAGHRVRIDAATLFA